MAKRFTDTDKYKKTFMRSLPGPYKLFWDYLYHDCNHAGIWHVDFQIAQIYLGDDMPINPEMALRLFNETEPRVEVLDNGKKWFIRPFIEFQYKAPIEHLNPANKLHNSILLTLVKEGLIKPLASPMQAPCIGAKDKDKDKYGVKGGMGGKRFIPPTPEEVNAYAASLSFDLDGSYFCDYYQERNWKYKGNVPMKDWKTAVRLWKRNGFSQTSEKSEVPLSMR